MMTDKILDDNKLDKVSGGVDLDLDRTDITDQVECPRCHRKLGKDVHVETVQSLDDPGEYYCEVCKKQIVNTSFSHSCYYVCRCGHCNYYLCLDCAKSGAIVPI